MARSASGQSDERSRIDAALRHIPADDQDLWLPVGIAIKTGQDEDGIELWHDWSRMSERYQETVACSTWRSLRAEGHGYVPIRPERTVAARAGAH